MSSWVDGLAEWTEGNDAFLSVAFTWRIPEAREKAIWYRSLGYRVVAGGPALFLPKLRRILEDVAEVGGDFPDAIIRHNPDATIASRGCPVGCWFCIVPPMEGKTFTLLPNFPVRPILCDNNISALPAEYQDYIVRRYIDEAIPLRDANSGFEPRTFDSEVFARWRPILKGPWRFAYDDSPEGIYVEPVMAMLRKAGVSPRRMQVYTLIGNEPFEECMTRIEQVVRWGGEPYAQPVMKLNALDRTPMIRFDWTERKLRRVQRWCNYARRAKVPWSDYDSSARTGRCPRAESHGLFDIINEGEPP